MVVSADRIHELYDAEKLRLEKAGAPPDHVAILQGLRSLVHLELREKHGFDGSQDTWEQAGVDIKAAGRWRDAADPGPPRPPRPAAPGSAPFWCPTVLGALEVPDDFPSAAFEGAYLQAISEVVHVQQFAGSWMGIAYRFKACAENAEAFRHLVAALGSNVPTEQRFSQDREMFEFHVNGYSALECLFYAMYFTAELVAPARFPVDNLQAITPQRTTELFDQCFPTEPITRALKETLHTEDYDDWGHLRNVLAHRIASGRTVTFTTRATPEVPPDRWLAAVPPAPKKARKIPLAARTLPPLVITEDGLLPRRQWLARRLELVLSSAHEFVAKHL